MENTGFEKKEYLPGINRIYTSVSLSAVIMAVLIITSLMCILPSNTTFAMENPFENDKLSLSTEDNTSSDNSDYTFDLNSVTVEYVSNGDGNESGELVTEADPLATIDVSVWDYQGGSYCKLRENATVADALWKTGYKLGEYDILNYSLDTVIFQDMNVEITRIEYDYETVSETIQNSVQYIDVSTIPRGTESLQTLGHVGRYDVVYKTCVIDGVNQYTAIDSQGVAIEPLDTVYYRGVGGTYTDSSGNVIEYSYYIDVTATAYEAGGRTATGTTARNGVIAVDQRVIPLGTQVYIVSDIGDMGLYTAEDTGGFIKGYRIDICMEGTQEDLLKFGRRSARVYILD